MTQETLDVAELKKQMIKQIEKMIIQTSVASTALAKVKTKKAKLKKSKTDTLAVTKGSMDGVASDLSDSLKGSWGTKAKESLARNSEKLADLS
ncbi:hypothetical protein I6N96_02095 [Enterococcus sp. BWM-S5]|uniref:Uncharacterized protein n=1 Tax=Enterococcus larvae TaxID=2794352 RepID=A0ABS4CGB6_9ENTE|nr:hypothetical protein [Enterococcus larvae]MBP1045055.1 hypothetical protein [Enterococcus larvae]